MAIYGANRGIIQIETVNGEYPINETDPLMDELKAAAFEYLLLNPGSDLGHWQKGLVEEYPTEVVDALGNNPDEVYAALAELWETDYFDPATGMEQKLCEWAMSFVNEYTVGVYYFLMDACGKLKKFNLM